MTNADKIRNMTNDELVNLLVWGMVGFESVPDCDCEHIGSGCAYNCPKERREKNVRDWLERSAEE